MLGAVDSRTKTGTDSARLEGASQAEGIGCVKALWRESRTGWRARSRERKEEQREEGRGEPDVAAIQ